MELKMESQKTLTLDTSFVKRLGAWFAERFPPIHAISGILLFLMLYSFAAKMMGVTIRYSLVESLAALGIVFEFLFLRVLDEHKDFRGDKVNHPERVLQRGLIELRHLRWLGGGAFVFQILLSVSVDRGLGPATSAFLLMLGYSLLMFKEFFIAEWLKKRLLLYTATHVMIVPFLANWIYHLCFTSFAWNFAVSASVALATISGFVYDVVRKMRGAEEEKATLDSTTKDVGLKGAVFLASLGVLVTYSCYVYVVKLAGGGIGAFSLSGVLAIICTLSFFKYGRGPTAKARKANEAVLGLLLLVNYLAIIFISLS